MNFCIKRANAVEYLEENKDKPRIPRPPNAFMLYANENRKKMSQLYPTESNKDISKRLGNGWKALNDEDRKKFFDRAKAIGIQHKKEFPDYVYNPKEARIRKAMRDATRERSIGASPMLPRPNARRATHSWVASHEDLMMSPLAGMRGEMESPVCSFSLASNGNNQFMGAMSGYSKLEPSPMPSATSAHTNYMQSNPLAQLQQHTEMWTEYQPMRPRSSGKPPDINNSDSTDYNLTPVNSYIMREVPQYQSATPDIPLMEKSPEHSSEALPVTTSETVTQNESQKGDASNFNDRNVLENSQPEATQEHFIPIFDQNDQQFGKVDESKMKKHGNILHLPLSSQNFCASPNLFSNDLKFQNNYIMEYFQNMPSMNLMQITTPNGISFPYATYAPANLMDSINNELQSFENVSEPSFFSTDVGFVPMSSLDN